MWRVLPEWNIESFKRLLAFFILISIALPLCQCRTRQDEPDASSSVQTASQPLLIKPVTTSATAESLVMLESIHFEEIAELAVAGLFAWPIGALLLRRRFRSGLAELLLNSGESIASGVSLFYLVQIIRLWGEIRYGGVIVLTCYSAYLLVSLWGPIRYLVQLQRLKKLDGGLDQNNRMDRP